MGKITAEIPEKKLALDYTSAKIIASPYNYTLSDRLIVYDHKTCFGYFNIYTKDNNTEHYLADALGLKRIDYLLPHPGIAIDFSKFRYTTIGSVAGDLEECDLYLGTIGSLIKYNNLILNEEIMIDDLAYISTRTKDLVDKGYLKALEVIHLMGFDKSSLIPNLMYLCTNYCDNSLEDLENITFAEKAIKMDKAPVIENCRHFEDPGDFLEASQLFSAAIVPFNTSHSVLLSVDNSFLLLGLIYSVVYGSELLYYFNNIKDENIKNALEDLFRVEYKDNTFCSKYLYTYNDMGNLEPCPAVQACFDNNTEERFNKIRKMLDTLLTLPDFRNQEIAKNLNYFGIPIFFARVVMSMHGYAYQTARIKHAVLLYKKAKAEGVINKEDFNSSVDCGSGLFSSDNDDKESDLHNELIDLDTFSTSSDETMSPEDSIEKEKSVTKKRKETPPALSAADMLKKDLHDSDYKYDIDYVKNDVSNKEAYNTIARAIKMITHELTRQIRDIKTYNTGGKQGGLTTGKLDKKNLWKYRNDPHIFYNNNYKLKEMDLAFGCILDESGSMWGEKIKNGRIVMIMLHEVLNSLGINHSIIGHTSSGMYNTKIYKYFQFKEEAHYSLDTPYSLVRADSRSGNCDSGALYYMQSVMKMVRNKDKIVIIFSDGQPTECTDLDLTEQVKNMEKNGIHVIGVGINFESIKNYYPDNANGKNLKEMVDIVVSILKRYVLEKKEA